MFELHVNLFDPDYFMFYLYVCNLFGQVELSTCLSCTSTFLILTCCEHKRIHVFIWASQHVFEINAKDKSGRTWPPSIVDLSLYFKVFNYF